jgi:hypothetical protein
MNPFLNIALFLGLLLILNLLFWGGITWIILGSLKYCGVL